MENQEVTIKTVARRLKNHVKRQKYAYLASAVAILLLQGNVRNLKAITAFLVEKGIDPMEFWCPEEFAEKVSQ